MERQPEQEQNPLILSEMDTQEIINETDTDKKINLILKHVKDSTLETEGASTDVVETFEKNGDKEQLIKLGDDYIKKGFINDALIAYKAAKRLLDYSKD